MDIEEINRIGIEQFRAGADIDGMNRDRLVLLTTVGRKSGESRTAPMMFHDEGDRLLVIASSIGARDYPNWYLDLAANPGVTVEVTETYEATATTIEGDELPLLR